MKIENAAITILVSEEGTTIELRDRDAGICFAKVKLTPVQLSQALSRLSHTDCECEVFGLDKLGKTQEHELFVFEIPKELASSRNAKELVKLASEHLALSGRQDWITTDSFGSQNSFFAKDSKQYARCTIRRWI